MVHSITPKVLHSASYLLFTIQARGYCMGFVCFHKIQNDVAYAVQTSGGDLKNKATAGKKAVCWD